MEEVGGWSFGPHTGVWTARWYEDARYHRSMEWMTASERATGGRTLHVEYSPHLVRQWVTERGTSHHSAESTTLAQVLADPTDYVLCPRCFFRRPGPEPDPYAWMRVETSWTP